MIFGKNRVMLLIRRFGTLLNWSGDFQIMHQKWKQLISWIDILGSRHDNTQNQTDGYCLRRKCQCDDLLAAQYRIEFYARSLAQSQDMVNRLSKMVQELRDADTDRTGK